MKSKQYQAQALVAQMSLEEKAAFCSGRSFWRLEALERLGLPSIMVTDGPHGLRKQAGSADHAGLASSVPATCFPTASALACSWDRELLAEIGAALGEQCAAENVALAPGETRQVALALDDAAFAVYDTGTGTWVLEGGAFEIRIGASSRDIRLKATLQVTSAATISEAGLAEGPEIRDGALTVSDDRFAAMLGKPVPAPEQPTPYHLNSSLGEIADTRLGARLKSKTVATFSENLGPDGADATLDRMMSEMVNDLPLRALVLLSGGKPGFRTLQILVAVLNRRFLKALRLSLGSRLPSPTS